jgi:hypothetical protein
MTTNVENHRLPLFYHPSSIHYPRCCLASHPDPEQILSELPKIAFEAPKIVPDAGETERQPRLTPFLTFSYMPC